MKRRSRMVRMKQGKRLALTARDIEIFKLLSRYRYLRSTYIHAFVGGASETRFKERLGDLFHEGYVDRPIQQWQFANARYQPAVYEIGVGAIRSLREAGIVVDNARCLLASGQQRQFLHSLMICEILASIDLDARSKAQLRFVAWPEILAKAPETTCASPAPFRLPVPSGGYLVPDGLFGIEYATANAKAYRFFALEADRGTMPLTRSDPKQTSYLGKVNAYRTIIAHKVYKTHLGLPNLLVLTITVGASRLHEMLAAVRDGAENGAFLFKAVEPASLSRPANHLACTPWERAGFPPINIGTADE